MRLATPFVRLPLRVDADALASEISALPPEAWIPHPEGAPGNTAVPLVSLGGDPLDDGTRGPMLPTPHLATLPYTVRVLAALDTVVGRTRLMRIEEEGELSAHIDSNYYWWDHLRVHVPVLTTPDVTFRCGVETTHMAAGEAWVFDTWRRHGVLNPAGTPRVHLVADTVGSAALWDRIDSDRSADRFVDPRDPAEATFVTEAVNHAVVMSPWELETNLRELLAELVTTEPGVAEQLADGLRDFRHGWRAAWAVYGDSPSGWDTFERLRSDADALVVRVGNGAELPNQLRIVEAIRQLVLRPGLSRPAIRSAVPEVRATPPRADPASAPGPPTMIHRPVFVVSSPRAGSTLAFETLTNAAELFTIGGESHQLIEGIHWLHPSTKDWASNRLDGEDATPEVVGALHQRFIAELRDRDGRAAPPGPVRMLEKTPKNALRVPFLAAAFPDAAFVYLYRDPRETISSMLDAWRSGRFVTYPELPEWNGPPWSLLLTPGWRDLADAPLAEIVTAQWKTATTMLLDDLEKLGPDRWSVAAYDRLVADPDAEMQRLCELLDLEWDREVSGPLPLSQHTVDSPHPEKWRRNAAELEPSWDGVRDVMRRAREIFAAPPRVKPVHRPPTATRRAAVDQQITPLDPAAPFRSTHTLSFTELLNGIGSSVAVSTYQTGRVIVLRADGDRVNTHFRTFASAMGLARRGPLLAVGTKTEVLVFQDQPAISARLEPPGRHDACFTPRHAYTTGDIAVHDLAFGSDNLWVVNTSFSCLCTLDEVHSFVPRWRPPFITALIPEDRCHLNGVAIVDGAPRFVTVLGMTDAAGAWRDHKADGGVLLDVESGEPVATGLCMPHSPRWHNGKLWVLESGRGALGVVDIDRGIVDDVAVLPGFTRGLAFAGRFAFVGLSQVREHFFDGVPLKDEGAERNCGVWVVDLETGDVVAYVRFEEAIQELFEVVVLANLRFPEIVEPGAELVESSYVLPDTALADVPEALRS